MFPDLVYLSTANAALQAMICSKCGARTPGRFLASWLSRLCFAVLCPSASSPFQFTPCPAPLEQPHEFPQRVTICTSRKPTLGRAGASHNRHDLSDSGEGVWKLEFRQIDCFRNRSTVVLKRKTSLVGQCITTLHHGQLRVLYCCITARKTPLYEVDIPKA